MFYNFLVDNIVADAQKRQLTPANKEKIFGLEKRGEVVKLLMMTFALVLFVIDFAASILLRVQDYLHVWSKTNTKISVKVISQEAVESRV